MNKSIFTLLLGLILALTLGCGQQRGSERNSEAGTSENMNTSESTSNASLNSTDRMFVDKATMDNMTEIQLAQAVSDKTNNAEVKQLSQTIINDHKNVGQRLQQIVQPMSVTMPNHLDQEHQQKIQEITSKSGNALDKAYVDFLVQAHQNAIDLFQNEATNGEHPELKNFAQMTVSDLQGHLDKAKDLQGKLK